MWLNEIVDSIQIDARGFQYQIIIIQITVIIFANDELQVLIVFIVINFKVFAPVGRHNIHVGKVFSEEAVGRDTFSAEAENDDFLVSNLI